MTFHRPPAMLAGVVLAAGLVAGACGGGNSNRATTATTSAPSATTVPAGSGQAAVTASDLKPIDDATSQLDNELGSADQGLNATEGDPTQ